MLERSSPRLLDSRSGWPEWVALRALEFRWKFQSRFSGEDTRFLFLDFGATARDMLDAELALSLQPAPQDDGPSPVPSTSPGAAALALPGFLIRRYSPEDFRRWAPAQARPEDTLLIRLGADEIVAVRARGGAGDFEVDDVVARWTRRGASVDLGPKGRWPLELLLALARVLGAPAAPMAPVVETFDALPAGLAVWQLAGSALRTAASVQGWLDGADRGPLDPRLEGLRCRWRVGGGHLTAGMLVNRSGEPAGTEEPDTFLAPFRVELTDAEPRLSVVVGAPDVAVEDDLRGRLLERFAATSEIDGVAAQWNAATGARLTRADVERWCDPARDGTIVLRARRGEETDAFLLVLSGEAAGVPVAAVISAEETMLAVENARLVVKALDDVDLEFAGRASAADLEWRGGARWLCEVLSVLLRWRALL